MSTKFQSKPRYPIIPTRMEEDDEDIIEIEEIPSPNQIKASQKYKEKTPQYIDRGINNESKLYFDKYWSYCVVFSLKYKR